MLIINRKAIALICQVFILASCLLFSAAAHSASKTLLVLGDSLSAEYGLARGAGWVALLEKRLEQGYPAAQIINASISGETTSGGKTRLPELLKKYRPDIVILELGGNDALRGLALPASEGNFRDMLRLSRQAGAKVLLVGMRIPPNYGRAYAESFFSIYGRVAKETRTALVPFMLEGIADKPELFQADRIHPQAQAHPLILENIWPHLQNLLRK